MSITPNLYLINLLFFYINYNKVLIIFKNYLFLLLLQKLLYFKMSMHNLVYLIQFLVILFIDLSRNVKNDIIKLDLENNIPKKLLIYLNHL